MPNSTEDLSAIFDLAWPGDGARLAHGDLAHGRSHAFVRVSKPQLELPRLDMRTELVPLDDAHNRLYWDLAGLVEDQLEAPGGTNTDVVKAALLQLIAAATSPATVLDPEARFQLPSSESGAVVSRLREAPTSHVRPAKIVRTAQLVAANASSGRKTLVWSSFLGNVAALREALREHSPAVITGETPVEDPGAATDRARELERFRSDADCRVLIATPQTLGEGVSLHHGCWDQIHVDRGFSAGTFLQSLDRTHRLGMPADARPTCTVLLAKDTIDSRVHEILSRKVAAMSAALNDSHLGVLADAEVSDLTPEEVLLGDEQESDLIDLLRSVVIRP